MSMLGIIGGTGLAKLDSLKITRREVVHTPYGEPSSAISHGKLGGREVVFLARHGYGHTIPPHRVNYRANIWALQSIGVENIVAVGAVGAISSGLTPGSLAIPDQLVDYTHSREQTFFDGPQGKVTHIEFSEPYCSALRALLLSAVKKAGYECCTTGTYGVTQGPRLETAQEINRMDRDGCDMVGMTGMPEAALARELGLCYASCAVVANMAAGRGEGPISMADIKTNVEEGMKRVRELLKELARSL